MTVRPVPDAKGQSCDEVVRVIGENLRFMSLEIKKFLSEHGAVQCPAHRPRRHLSADLLNLSLLSDGKMYLALVNVRAPDPPSAAAAADEKAAEGKKKPAGPKQGDVAKLLTTGESEVQYFKLLVSALYA